MQGEGRAIGSAVQIPLRRLLQNFRGFAAMCSGEGEGNPAGGVELPASSLSRDGVWGHPWPVPGPQGALSHWWTPTRDELLVLGGLCGPRLLLREDCVADVPLQGPFQGALASV